MPGKKVATSRIAEVLAYRDYDDAPEAVIRHEVLYRAVSALALSCGKLCGSVDSERCRS